MTSRFNQTPNVVYKRTSRGNFYSTAVRSGGGEFSTGTLGKFHPALTLARLGRESWRLLVACNSKTETISVSFKHSESTIFDVFVV